MAEKAKTIRTKTISLEQKQGTFGAIFQKIKGSKKKQSDLAALRNLLTNEKARILSAIKKHEPDSLYALAKLLERDFKSVREDVHTLEKFGFLDMIPLHKGKREKLKPVLSLDVLEIKINI